LAALHDENGRFAPGNPGGPGRPGGLSPRAKQGKKLAQSFLESEAFDLQAFWKELLAGEDKRLAFDTMKFLFEHAYGRPPVNDDTSMFEGGAELPDVFDAWDASARTGDTTEAQPDGEGGTP